MIKPLRGISLATLSFVVMLIAGCGGGGNDNSAPPSATPTTVVPPLPLPGPYAVACSNVAEDFTKVKAGETAENYWEGSPSDSGTARYITDLLVDPTDTLAVTVNVPNSGTLYGSFAGKQVKYVLIACYPTVATNPRPDYPLPSGKVIPHMQTGADAPIFADAAVRYPVLMFSHGYGGSPISSDHIIALSIFASYGYVIVAPFHGDPRISDLKIEDLQDAVRVLGHLDDFVALQSLRPLSMSAALDLMLAHPQWRDHLDASQIGAFGASMGGETVMLMAGAGLTTSLGFSWTQVEVDPRVKAAVGYVPYFGEFFLPAFGRDQHGLDGISLPFLGISGSADTTAPQVMAQQGISRLTGTRELVSLAGVKHGFDVAATNDIFTWSLVFLDAQVRGNPAARKQLSTMGSVSGGVDDSVVIPYNGAVQ